jgi:hypothetical protein
MFIRTASVGLLLLCAACGDDESNSGSTTGTSTTGSSTGGEGGSAGSTGVGGGSAGAGTGGTGTGGTGTGGAGGELSERRVFVSSDVHDGAFGGLSGVDAFCQGLADAAGLGGRWIAWAGDLNEGPLERFVHSTVPYVLVGGAQIAANWDDLIDASIEVPIDRDEAGTPLATPDMVWVRTGVFSSGEEAPADCEGFTDAQDFFSLSGLPTAVDQNWTMSIGRDCSELDRIYCFEQ